MPSRALSIAVCLGLVACGGPTSSEPTAPRPGTPVPDGEAPYVGDREAHTPSTDGRLPTRPDGRVLPTSGEAPPEVWQCDHKGPTNHVLVDGSCFLPVAAGTYRRGAQASDPAAPNHDPHAAAHEGPVKEVAVEAFWIQRFEVSAQLYQGCLDAGWCRADEVDAGGAYGSIGHPKRLGWPANGVSWHGAARLCDWLGGRLPTETEWEYAARGTDGRRFPWGDRPACGIKYFDSNVDTRDEAEVPCAEEGPSPIRSPRMRSAVGAVGMAGNVWEWTSDAYAADAYSGGVTPDTPDAKRVQRGGGWLASSAWELRSSARGVMPPDQKLHDVGLRCAWPAERP